MRAKSLASAWPIPGVDPYPTLAQLRTVGPVHRLEDLDAWLVVAHREAHEILRGQGWSSDPRRSPAAVQRMGLDLVNTEVLAKTVLFAEAEVHQRLRHALSGFFTPKAVGALRHRIASVVETAFVGHDPDQPWEIMDEIAYPVPLGVICELLDTGIDLAMRLRADATALTALIDPLAEAHAAEAGASAAMGLTYDLVALVAERRGANGEDLLSCLLDNLDPDEAMFMTLLLLVAGHETTANLIGNAVISLHDHPQVARDLRRHPENLAHAVEEFLRYESPVQLTARVATEPHRVGGVPIEKGDQVYISLGAANRDPDVFPEPDRLVPTRITAGHLAFGHGVHFCAGASLARAEAEDVLRHVLALDPPVEDRQIRASRDRSATFRRIASLTLGS